RSTKVGCPPNHRTDSATGERPAMPSPTLTNAVYVEFSEFKSVISRPVWTQAWARSEESSRDFTPTNMTARIPRRRSITNAAIDRLRHLLFQGNILAARDNESITRSTFSALSKTTRVQLFQLACRKR